MASNIWACGDLDPLQSDDDDDDDDALCELAQSSNANFLLLWPSRPISLKGLGIISNKL